MHLIYKFFAGLNALCNILYTNNIKRFHWIFDKEKGSEFLHFIFLPRGHVTTDTKQFQHRSDTRVHESKKCRLTCIEHPTVNRSCITIDNEHVDIMTLVYRQRFKLCVKWNLYTCMYFLLLLYTLKIFT